MHGPGLSRAQHEEHTMSLTRLRQLLAGLGFVIPTPLPAGVTALNGPVLKGTGTPEAVVTAPIGTLYVNLSGGASTTLYVKTSGTGNTGWTAK